MHIFTVLLFLLSFFLIGKTFYNLIFAYVKRDSFFFVELIRPVIFIKYFASCLTIPFLSQYILHVALHAGFSEFTSSLIYVLYQVTFVVMLIPTGYVAEFSNIKYLLLIGYLLEGVLYVFLGLFPNIWVIFFIQIIFGFVIPISSSCEYAFIFNHSDNSNRAESLALYSNTLKGAAISGIFLGGFFFESISASNTFIIAGFFILVCLLYIGLLIPNLRRKDTLKIANSFLKLKSLNFKDLKVFLNVKFLLMMLLVALPIGILQEGVFLFGIPIILSHFHVREVLIGEVMVLFSLGYFATNKYISKKADKNKKELTYIFWGLLGISISLIVMSIILRGSLLMLGFGLFLLGVFRGFIYSPSISVVSKSTVARITGKNVSLSVFRLFEMVGRILGPLLVGLLLIFDDSSLGTFIFIAFIMLLCAFVFKVFMKKNLK